MSASRRASVRRAVFRLVRATGLPAIARHTVQRHRVTILLYHDPDPREFGRHLGLLQRHYAIVPLRTAVAALESGRLGELPDRALVLTLDDGHSGNYELGPVIRELGVPATIFLCSGVVGSRRGFWFNHTTSQEALKRVPDEQRVAELDSTGFRQDDELPERESLSDSEILELSGDLIEFQSHSISHPILPRCTDAKARHEIIQSRLDLIERYGLDVYALAFPNGDYSDRELALAREGGYRCALTLDRGFNSGATDPFRLRRVSIDDTDGIDELIVKASGVWGVVARARRLVTMNT
jgi:peptidoglycan/xylan/chitin deacetylase (PgdA/CDA1 family)